ncbi:hypothetical protein [Arthrobacter roseus]|uniref:hypothetical protein n=1 Tax=Arthrobacter roseus TaxID=136274 RepID=UPI0030843B44|nr:hypothetical protein [Arthrobacter roseus]
MKNWSVAPAASVVLAAIIATSYTSRLALAVVVGLAVVLFAWGWPHALGMPARKSVGSVIGLAGLGSLALSLYAPLNALMTWMPIIVAIGVIAVFLIQLFRGTGQSGRLESTLGSAAGVMISAFGGGWVAADRLSTNATNSGVMLVTGIGVFVAGAICTIRWPDRIVAPLGILLGGLAGPLTAILFTRVSPLAAAIIGIACAAVVVSFRRLVLSREFNPSIPAWLSLSMCPVVALGALVYFLDKLLIA